jgi:hypothetical protein
LALTPPDVLIVTEPRFVQLKVSSVGAKVETWKDDVFTRTFAAL